MTNVIWQWICKTRMGFISLMLFLSNAPLFAMGSKPADPNAPPPPFWVQWTPMIVMIAVFYFLLIRPQAKQRKERQNMLNALKRGDRIVTQGGFIATVVNVGPAIVEIKLNEDTKVKIQRSAVAEILPAQTETKDQEAVSANHE